MTQDELLSGLKEGKVCVVDRRDFPLLPYLLELERDGKVKSAVIIYDEQSSALRFWWASSDAK